MTLKHYQDLILHIHGVIDKEIGIAEGNGKVIACTDERKIGCELPQVRQFLESGNLSSSADGYQFQNVCFKSKPGFVVFIKSDSPADGKALSLIAYNISAFREYSDEKYDRTSFIKKVLLGGIDTGDAYARAKEFHISDKAARVAYCIKIEAEKEVPACEIIQGLFPNRARDFVVALGDCEVALIKELKSVEDKGGVEKIAAIIMDTMQTELMTKARIGIGTEAGSLEDIRRSYREAQASLEIGSIFNSESSIFSYGNLGIGRLIRQLPPELCRLFLQEIFKNGRPESLDSEILRTIRVFFENNLNISETARKLYIHRNTLVYRIEKINRLTGLDITKFDDAATLKVALLVRKYTDRCG